MSKTKDKKKAKTKLITPKFIKSAIFLIAVIIFCVVYYYVSPYIFAEKASSIDKFPLIINSVETGDLQLHFIDVGQGDCTYIKTPDGKNILIDAGIDNSDTTERIISYLKKHGVKTIDYVIATHPDADHIGGFPQIFRSFKIGFVFRPFVKSSNMKTDMLKDRFNPPEANYSTTNIYADFLVAIRNERVNWVFVNKDVDLSIDYGSNLLKLDFLTPVNEIKQVNYYDLNDYSPMLKVSYAGFSCMFTGDATTLVEGELMENYSELVTDCDLLKVAHHGSDTSTSYDFVDMLSPNYAVVSCGEDSSYSHPKQSVLTTLSAFKVKLFRTDKQGNIVFTINSTGEVTYQTEKNYSGSLYKGY